MRCGIGAAAMDVQGVFDGYPDPVRKQLLAIRELIYEVAEGREDIGPLSETLKWSQPSYLTETTGSGTTVRIDRYSDNQVAVYFHCQTTLVETFRDLLPDLTYSKNRAILFEVDEPLPEGELKMCIEMALMYKLNKRSATMR